MSENHASTVALIFSKDRAMQLDACLRSFALQCGDHASHRKQVIYKCSDAGHASQYVTLQAEHPDVAFTAERDFHQDLQTALAGVEHVLFAVDDNIFVHPFSLAEIVSALRSEKAAIGFSLRLGRNITRCYPHSDAPEAIPEALQIGGGMLLFRWTDAALDFGYPLEVSSSVFRVSQLLPLFQASGRLTHPNHLEECLNRGKIDFIATHPSLLCFERSVAFCNPVNVVQQTHPNRVGHEPSHSVLSLMERFEMGYRIDVGAFRGFTPDGCHQEVPLKFPPPGTAWNSLTASLHISTTPRANSGAPNKSQEDLSLQCTLKADETGEEDIYTALLALRACKIAANENAAGWLPALGRHYLKQRAIVEKDLTVIGKTASDHLARAQWLETQLKTAGEDLSLARERELALMREVEREKQEAERERQRAKMLDKRSYRALTRVHSLVRFTKVLFTFPIPRGEHRFRITDACVLPDRHLLVQGCLLSMASTTGVAIRALVARHDDRQLVRADQHDRSDLVTLYSRDGTGAATGFKLMVPLGNGLNIVLLQYQRNGKWRTFLRHNIWKDRFRHTRRPQIVSQERWPNEKPLVSVVIPCFNSKSSYAETIASVFAQTWRDLEVIVVDCGAAIPENVFSLTRPENVGTKLLHLSDMTLVAARNAGIKEATGKYVCCLDAGEAIAATYLEKCIFRLETEGLDICDSSKVSLGRFSPRESSIAQRLTPTAVFSRALWQQCRGFTEAANDGGHVSDFWRRMGEAGAVATTLLEPHLVQGKTEDPINGENANECAAPSISVGTRCRNPFRQFLPGLKRSARLAVEPDSILVKNPLVNLLRAPGQVESQSPHVLVCLPYLTIGGAERLISQICQGLGEQGFRVTVLTTLTPTPSHGSAESWFEKATDRIYCLPRFLGKDGWKKFILRLIDSHGIDILWQAGSAFIYELLPEIKTAFPRLKVADFLFNEVGHTANNRMFDYCIDLIITENSAVRAWLLGHGETEDRIRVIPNGVDLRLFFPKPRQKIPFETSDRDFVVGFFGRLSHEKAPDVFVEIAARFKSEHRILFLLAGDGPMMGELSKLTITHGLGDSMKLLGFADSREYLPCCDAVIAPSRLDGRPNSVMEALAMGIPVLASNVGGMAELVSDGQTGFLCTAASVDQFVEKVALLFKDRRMCKQLGVSAGRHAVMHFDIRTTIASIGKAFHGLLQQTDAMKSRLETLVP